VLYTLTKKAVEACVLWEPTFRKGVLSAHLRPRSVQEEWGIYYVFFFGETSGEYLSVDMA